MAPRGFCTNLPPLPPVPAGPAWKALAPTLERALERWLDALAAHDEGGEGDASDADEADEA